MAVAPTPVAAAPDAPDRAQRATFSARATAFFDWIKNTFVAGVNALASNVYANAQDAASSAANAVAQSASATAQAGIATAQAAAATSAAATATTQAASITTAAATSTAKADVATAKAAEATAAAAMATAVTLGVSTGRPVIRPSLSLDFSNSCSVDPRVTFVRASSATRINRSGLRETVASGAPRIDHNPLTLACLGLLSEAASTNLAIASDHLSLAAGYVSINYSVWPYCPEAPGLDGALSMTKLVALNTGSAGFWRATSAITINTSYTIMADFRRGTSAKWLLGVSDNVDSGCSVYFDALDPNTAPWGGAFGGWAFVAAGAYECQGGIWRCWATVTSNGSDTSTNIYACPVSSNGGAVTAGDSCYVGALDLVAGSYVGSHIQALTTFTGRSSTGTYIDSDGLLKTAASGVARYSYNPTNLNVAPALLLEAAATNLLTYSEEFDNAAWEKFGATVTPNLLTAPDGSLTVDKVVESTANSEHYTRSVAASCTAGTYVASVYWHTSSERSLYLRVVHLGDTNAISQVLFDKSTLTLGAVSGNAVSASAQNVGNGWWRISLVFSITATRNVQHGCQLYSTAVSYAGDGTSGVYVWGAQLEVGSFPTSYIPTTTAQVTRAADTSTSAATTRAADVATMTGANFASWYRQDEGTFVAFARRDALSPGRLITLSDGTSGNQICITLIVSSTSLRADLEVTVGGVLQVATTTTPVFAVGSMFAIAFVYKANDFAISVNGTTVVTDTSGAVPIVDRVHIGTDRTGANSHNGTVARIAYYPKRLTNAELQALTA